jgi:hypothetical protein
MLEQLYKLGNDINGARSKAELEEIEKRAPGLTTQQH